MKITEMKQMQKLLKKYYAELEKSDDYMDKLMVDRVYTVYLGVKVHIDELKR